MRIVIGIAFAGFLGAVTRYELGNLFPQLTETTFPWATLGINIIGSLLLGLITGLVSRKLASSSFGEIAGTGFLGAFTTFSTFNGQLWLMIEHRAFGAAIIYMLLSAIGGWWLAAIGLAWGRRKPA